MEIKSERRCSVCVSELSDGARGKGRAAKGKIHSQVMSLKDSINSSEVLIVTRTHTFTHTNSQ